MPGYFRANYSENNPRSGVDKMLLGLIPVITPSFSGYSELIKPVINDASDYRTNRLYRTPNPSPLVH